MKKTANQILFTLITIIAYIDCIAGTVEVTENCKYTNFTYENERIEVVDRLRKALKDLTYNVTIYGIRRLSNDCIAYSDSNGDETYISFRADQIMIYGDVLDIEQIKETIAKVPDVKYQVTEIKELNHWLVYVRTGHEFMTNKGHDFILGKTSSSDQWQIKYQNFWQFYE